MKIVVMFACYACFAVWGCRKLGARGGRWKASALFVFLIVYCAGIHLAAMRSWPPPTPTRLTESVLFPAGQRLSSMLHRL